MASMACKLRSTALAAGLAVLGVFLPGCGASLLITPVFTRTALVETRVERDSWLARDKIAVIDVSGVLRNNRGMRLLGEGEHPVSLLREQLDKARKDPAVKAVILRINSPGGSVTASDLMHDEILRFRTSGKPVSAVFMDVAASGGYYIACACDEIVAHRTSVTGSIGVIMQLFDLSGTLHLIGVKPEAITSGPSKDAGSPFRALKPEERQQFQAIVDSLYERFVEVVVEGRPKLDEQQVRKLADGRIYHATQAAELGLVDRIGTLRETIQRLKEQVGSQRVQVVTYHRPLAYRPNYYAHTPYPATGQVNLVNFELPGLGQTGTPQFLYLWQPGL